MMSDLRPNKAEKEYLQFSYNSFYEIFDEVFSDSFWNENSYYRFSKIKDAFSIYTELLNYEPIAWFIEYIRKNRPPMEAEIGSELFKFIRNVVIHFPYFKKWDNVWIDKDVANWYKEGQSIDRFLRKYENRKSIKYRIWDGKNKKMTYLSINFPKKYSSGNKVYLKEILSEREGIKFSLVFMREVMDSQVEKS